MSAMALLVALALAGVVAFLAGCSALPPEREERDRIILAALEPCRKQYSDFVYTWGVSQDGTVRFWYYDYMVSKIPEVQGCIAAARKDLKVGPGAPGRLAKAGPAKVSISTLDREVAVPVRVNGIVGTMAVREKSPFTSMTAAYAKRAAVQVVEESPTIRLRFGDETTVIPYARTRALEVGDASVEALDIVVYEVVPGNYAVDGVLGSNFLSHFKLTIDRLNARLTLEPLRAP